MSVRSIIYTKMLVNSGIGLAACPQRRCYSSPITIRIREPEYHVSSETNVYPYFSNHLKVMVHSAFINNDAVRNTARRESLETALIVVSQK